MPRKVYNCKACDEVHERLLNSKCNKQKSEEVANQSDSDSSDTVEQMNINKQVLQELKQLNGRISKVEQMVESVGQVSLPKSTASGASGSSLRDQEDADLFLPTLASPVAVKATIDPSRSKTTGAAFYVKPRQVQISKGGH